MSHWKHPLRLALMIIVVGLGYTFVPGPHPLVADTCQTTICTDIRCNFGVWFPVAQGYWIGTPPP
jgi:hypothetical protein